MSSSTQYIITGILLVLLLVASYVIGGNAGNLDQVLVSSMWLQIIFGVIAYGNLVMLTAPAAISAYLFCTNVLKIKDDDRDSTAFITMMFWLAGSFLLIWPVLGLLGVVFHFIKRKETA